MIWIFNLINRNGTSAQVEEPIGWDAHQFSLNRNQQHHGIFQSLETSGLQWIDSSFTILNNEYLAEGANGFMELRVRYQCEGETAVEYYRGKFDFNTFKRECGDTCYIECQVLATTCANTFLSRLGQKIDIETATNFDGDSITPLNIETMTIEGQTIFMQNKATNSGTNSGNAQVFPMGTSPFFHIQFCPVLPVQTFNEFGIFNPNGAILGLSTTFAVPYNVFVDVNPSVRFGEVGRFLSIWERESDPLNCIDNDATIDARVKGTLNLTTTNFDADIFLNIVLVKYDPTTLTTTVIDNTALGSMSCVDGVPNSFSFDDTYFNTPAYEEAEYLLYYFELLIETTVWGGVLIREVNFNIDFDSATKFGMDLVSDCDPTTSKAVALPELLEFFPSVYMDEECPEIAIEEDLRSCLNDYHITNGLFIREVTEPNPAKLFVSYEWLFRNLAKVFNIGWGFDNDETDIIIGNIERFYKTTESLNVGVVDKATFSTALDLVYGTVQIGYNKWEAEEYNGLDEPNTKREYRRNIDSNSKELDLISELIAAGYTIEVTRRKNQGKTGTADTPYDNDIFIVNSFYQDGDLFAYRGASDSSNLYSPSTRMNLRLTPVRNLLRWWKTIASPRPTITNEEHIFNSGDGNYNAACRFNEECDPSDDIIVAENQTVISTDVKEFTPLWHPIYSEFSVPLSMVNFETIKSNIYNAIRFRCGGVTYSGSIINMGFDPIRGIADFKLLILR
jgi:hypothetical protein